MRVEQIEMSYWVRVTQDDGSNEWFCPVVRSFSPSSLATLDDDLFYATQNGSVFVFSFEARRRIAKVAIPGAHIERAIPSRDGRYIFAVTSDLADRYKADRAYTFHAIEAATGSIARTIGALHLVPSTPMVETEDGCILLASWRLLEPAMPRKLGLVCIEPKTGTTEVQTVGSAHDGRWFQWFSPKGKYVVRIDERTLPMRRDTRALLRLLPVETQYGLCVQVWETRPLRFVSRHVIAWITEAELSSWDWSGTIAVEERQSDGTTKRKLMAMPGAPVFKAMSQQADLTAPPLLGFDRTTFPKTFQSDDALWNAVSACGRALHEFVSSIAWDADDSGFWILFHRLRPAATLRRVGLDGTASALIQLSRQLDGWSEIDKTLNPRSISPLGNLQARVICVQGHATISAPPSLWEGDRRKIGEEANSWVTYPGLAENKRRRHTVDQIAKEKSTHTIKISDSTEGSCIAGIETLTRDIRERLHDLVLGDQFRIRVVSGKTKYSEQAFFEHVRKTCPRAAPALRQLMETYMNRALTLDLGPRVHDYYTQGDEGIGSLSYAMLALALMDRESLHLIRSFADCNDCEHSHFVPKEIVPAVIKAYGWRDPAVVELVAWMLLYNFYNAIEDTNDVWHKWGMAQAVRSMLTPAELADIFIRNQVYRERTIGFVKALERDIRNKTLYETTFITRMRERLLSG